MKLNVALTYLLYFGMAVMLHPMKNNTNSIFDYCYKEKKTTEVKVSIAKAEVLHAELLFKY